MSAPDEHQYEYQDEGLDFTCKDCGSHDLIVEHVYQTITTYSRFVPCECGAARDGEAASQQVRVLHSAERRGYLTDDHQVDWEKPEYEPSETQEDEVDVSCEDCCNDAVEEKQEWETNDEAEEEEIAEDSEGFYVRCRGCNREIEFGWSHPDRGGRIWPAESRDFAPRKSWPEPRYAESWAARGWRRLH